ncbi:MAG: hypothetical protein KY466_08580, partial [Gemmatimonadetes bacterium]|nr:hypothetical protein [Gemmatimonadota bacterium]
MRPSLISCIASSLVLLVLVASRPAVAETVDPRDVAASADRAITALSPHVTATSHPEALQRAFRAYFAFKAARPEMVRNPYYFFVDYGLDNKTRRGYVFDMEELELVEGPFTV